MPSNKKASARQEESPTKNAEARAKKNSDLSTANTKVKGTANVEQERATVPVNQRPEDRIR